jgi:glycine cleavage system aminomethyltransferase T
VGRDALLRREADRGEQVVRFRVDEEGVRAIRSGDPVASSRGECVGHVTSCAPVGSRQLGMAWVDRHVAAEGSRLLLFPTRQLERSVATREPAELSQGDRMPIHVHATVVRRFPR